MGLVVQTIFRGVQPIFDFALGLMLRLVPDTIMSMTVVKGAWLVAI